MTIYVVGNHADGQVVAGPVDYWTSGLVAMHLRSLSCKQVKCVESHRLRRLRMQELAGTTQQIALSITLLREGPEGGPPNYETLVVGARQLPAGETLDPRADDGPDMVPAVDLECLSTFQETLGGGVSQEMTAPETLPETPDPATPSLPPWAIAAATRLAQGLAIVLFALVHWRRLPRIAWRLLMRTRRAAP